MRKQQHLVQALQEEMMHKIAAPVVKRCETNGSIAIVEVVIGRRENTSITMHQRGIVV